MITVEKLKEMEPGTIFATGETELDIFDDIQTVRWVAIRGGIHDWAIYYHHPDKSDIEISRIGDKLHDLDKVQELVPADNEAIRMYRY